MKKSQLRNIIRQLIREQQDVEDIDQNLKPQPPKSSKQPPPNACMDPTAKVITFQRCDTNHLTGYCCATLNGVQASQANLQELTYINIAPQQPAGWYKVFQVLNPNNLAGTSFAGMCSGPPDPTLNYNTIPGPCSNAPSPCDPSNFTNAFPSSFGTEAGFPGFGTGACRACGFLGGGGIGGGSIYTSNQQNDPSPNPNFATLGDVCNYIDTNSCC